MKLTWRQEDSQELNPIRFPKFHRCKLFSILTLILLFYMALLVLLMLVTYENVDLLLLLVLYFHFVGVQSFINRRLYPSQLEVLLKQNSLQLMQLIQLESLLVMFFIQDIAVVWWAIIKVMIPNFFGIWADIYYFRNSAHRLGPFCNFSLFYGVMSYVIFWLVTLSIFQ